MFEIKGRKWDGDGGGCAITSETGRVVFSFVSARDSNEISISGVALMAFTH